MSLRNLSSAFAVLALLATIAQAGAALAQPASPTVIAVRLSEFSYSPSEFDLVRGQPYVLRLTNDGKHAHDLSAKAFFKTVTLASDSVAEVQDGAVELVMGESADVTFVANTPGTYEMHCTHPLHSMLGMTGKIVVR
jgi:uncharacterized cupredoxin-like copper-binding protein